MTHPLIQRAIFSSNWSGQEGMPGGVVYQDSVPADAYYLPPIPEGSGDSGVIRHPSGALKWVWSHTHQDWVGCPDYPSDYFAWDWSARYDLSFADELNPVWVLKSEALTTERPAQSE